MQSTCKQQRRYVGFPVNVHQKKSIIKKGLCEVKILRYRPSFIVGTPYSPRHPRRRSCRRRTRVVTDGALAASMSNLSDWPTRHTVPAAMACTALHRPEAQRWNDLPPGRQAHRPSAVQDVPTVVAPFEDDEEDEDEPPAAAAAPAATAADGDTTSPAAG